MWEEFVTRHGAEIERRLNEGDRPLVLINMVGVNLFQGLSLSTRYDSHMELDSAGKRVLLLIHGVEAGLNKVPVVWVYGKFSLTDTSGDSFYVGCDYCNRRMYAEDSVEFECLFCGQKQENHC
ncbi:unnamed protein product [Cuscuta epithymum]|uniref:Replication factor A C-terminal domain-containing protein n=1 Tax=Cuscuta epithymum TaxID=186058 RepID=A0AAV0FDK1_9ASTE|nr:unnamed protein product [Cuscuta epithymum]